MGFITHVKGILRLVAFGDGKYTPYGMTAIRLVHIFIGIGKIAVFV